MIKSDSQQSELPATVNEALQQAIAHHAQGRTQEAERLYRSVLKAVPRNAAAHHNLGVLAMEARQPRAALPHFKAAAEANQYDAQIWLSYVDALVQTNQADAARKVMADARRLGLSGGAVEAMAARLNAGAGAEPAAQEVQDLIALYEAGQYAQASALAQGMTRRLPLSGVGWKLLGATCKQLGRSADAAAALQKAAALSPGDAMAHYNFGIALRDLGRLEEAVASYRRALELDPGYADAHYNLGNALMKLARPAEAESAFRRALESRPDFAEAHCNLGIALKDQRRREEAEASFRRALAIKADYAAAHFNLGSVVLEMNRTEAAEAGYRRALEIRPGFAEAWLNLGQLLCDREAYGDAAAAFQKALDAEPADHGLDAAVWAAVLAYLGGNLEECRRKLDASAKIKDFRNKIFRFYWYLLDKLDAWHRKNDPAGAPAPDLPVLHVVGESHALATQGIGVRHDGREMRCRAEWIHGCKQWHLGNGTANRYRLKFERILARLPRASSVLLLFGEIDCRPDEGIFRFWKKHPDRSLADVTDATIDGYLRYVAEIGSRHGHRLIVCGVPAINLSSNPLNAADTVQFIDLIRTFNAGLKQRALAARMDFLDVYALTDRGDGFAGGEWHIDSNHLLPSAWPAAFDRHCVSGKSN